MSWVLIDLRCMKTVMDLTCTSEIAAIVPRESLISVILLGSWGSDEKLGK